MADVLLQQSLKLGEALNCLTQPAGSFSGCCIYPQLPEEYIISPKGIQVLVCNTDQGNSYQITYQDSFVLSAVEETRHKCARCSQSDWSDWSSSLAGNTDQIPNASMCLAPGQQMRGHRALRGQPQLPHQGKQYLHTSFPPGHTVPLTLILSPGSFRLTAGWQSATTVT